ncbi:MAG: chorismate lyase [Thiolinea sp.]
MNDLFSAAWQTQLPASASWQTPWLLAAGSLTQGLQQVCRAEFQVKVLKHEFMPAPEFICADLHMQPNESVLQRAVVLCDGDEPLVFASSLLPEAALTGRYQELRELGSRPLGHWIFSEPVLKRQSMLFAELPMSNALFKSLTMQTATSLLGRKTLFVGADKPFLVSEFFLPALQSRTGVQHGA